MLPLTVPEVRRLLLAEREPPGERAFHQWWSTFRRQHQATARRCHRARRATEQPEQEHPGTISVLPSSVPELDDARWDRVVALVPTIRRTGEQPELAQRTIVDGILWVARTGRSWKELPARFGPWETIHAYYHRWKQKGAWQPILAALRAPLEAVPP